MKRQNNVLPKYIISERHDKFEADNNQICISSVYTLYIISEIM